MIAGREDAAARIHKGGNGIHFRRSERAADRRIAVIPSLVTDQPKHVVFGDVGGRKNKILERGVRIAAPMRRIHRNGYVRAMGQQIYEFRNGERVVGRILARGKIDAILRRTVCQVRAVTHDKNVYRGHKTPSA